MLPAQARSTDFSRKQYCAAKVALRLAFAVPYMAATVADFVSLEVAGGSAAIPRLWPISTIGYCAFVTTLLVEAIIYVAAEVTAAMKPWTGANEDAAVEPFPSVVA